MSMFPQDLSGHQLTFLLEVPECHYANTLKRAFDVRAPKEWNSLPKDIRMKETVGSFKSALKTYLFKTAFY